MPATTLNITSSNGESACVRACSSAWAGTSIKLCSQAAPLHYLLACLTYFIITTTTFVDVLAAAIIPSKLLLASRGDALCARQPLVPASNASSGQRCMLCVWCTVAAARQQLTIPSSWRPRFRSSSCLLRQQQSCAEQPPQSALLVSSSPSNQFVLLTAATRLDRSLSPASASELPRRGQ